VAALRITRPTRACVSAVATLACGLAAVGCAELLGGLDEGSAREADAVDDAAVAEVGGDVTRASPWLEGFAHRVAFTIDSAEPAPLTGFATRLGLATRGLIAANKMRGDGADIRVTNGDGTTVVPHWIQSGLNGEATTLWAKLDVPAGQSRAFLYYGNPGAPAVSSLRDTFVDGVIANASFDNGTSPWTEAPPTNGGQSTLLLHDRRAEVKLVRPPAMGESSVGWCQFVTFPPGGPYRVVFDASTLLIDAGEAAIWTGGAGGHPVWRRSIGVGHESGIDSDRIDPGAVLLCLGVTVHASAGPQAMAVEFENLRVRLFAEHDPVAGPAGPEETR
jgi:hypothetical protein